MTVIANTVLLFYIICSIVFVDEKFKNYYEEFYGFRSLHSTAAWLMSHVIIIIVMSLNPPHVGLSEIL